MNFLFIPMWLLKSDLLQSTTYQLCYIGKCFLSNARHSTKHVKHLPSWRGWIVNTSQTGGHLERHYLLDDPTDKLLLLQHCARYWTFLPLHHSSGHRYCVHHQNTCLHANKIYCQEIQQQHRTQNTEHSVCSWDLLHRRQGHRGFSYFHKTCVLCALYTTLSCRKSRGYWQNNKVGDAAESLCPNVTWCWQCCASKQSSSLQFTEICSHFVTRGLFCAFDKHLLYSP